MRSRTWRESRAFCMFDETLFKRCCWSLWQRYSDTSSWGDGSNPVGLRCFRWPSTKCGLPAAKTFHLRVREPIMRIKSHFSVFVCEKSHFLVMTIENDLRYLSSVSSIIQKPLEHCREGQNSSVTFAPHYHPLLKVLFILYCLQLHLFSFFLFPLWILNIPLKYEINDTVFLLSIQMRLCLSILVL